MRIAVMGAGGVGAYVGARLARGGEEVAFIARGRHLDAMRQRGLRIDSPFGDINLPKVTASDRPADIGPVDLVLFTVKLWDTEGAAASLAPLLTPRTRVLTLQNGIDSVGLIGRHVPPRQVVGGVMYVSAYIAEPGVIRSPGGISRVVADALDGDPVIESLRAAGARSEGLAIDLTDNIDLAIWEKFVRLSAFSAATSLMRATCGPILANPESRALLRQFVDETVAVAAAAGHPVSAGYADAAMAFFEGLPGVSRASMAEDLDHGRRLELPWLSGRLHALGNELGVPTPAHSAAYRALSLYVDGVRKTSSAAA